MSQVDPTLKARDDGPLVHHDGFGGLVRHGGWDEQAISTFRLAAQAFEDGRFEDAADLARYTVEEAVEGHEIYGMGIESVPEYMRAHGVDDAVIEDEVRQIKALLDMPDGTPFDPEAGWQAYRDLIDRFVALCRAGGGAEGLDLLETARVTWLQFHDRKCDWLCGLFAAVARHLGEEHTIVIWDELMGSMYPAYARFDIDKRPWADSLDEMLHMAVFALRGHLSGPGRMGDVNIVEEADRWRIEFDPCGSGGRTMRPDPDQNLAARIEPPFNHAIAEEEHDWAWNRKGVCLYCTHCCQLGQRKPIQLLGYPARVIEPPVWPSDDPNPKCAWIVYKDPTKVPERYYREVGEEKPDEFGMAATQQRRAAEEQG